MKKLPQARTENLVEQNLGKETLIYDLTTHKAFNLNETSSIVYKACDGAKTFEALKYKHKFTDDFIYLALDELVRNNLLAGEYISPFANTNRREVIKKVGLATMLALPIIAGLVAPTAANAASGQSKQGVPFGGACIWTIDCHRDWWCVAGVCCQPGLISHGGNPKLPGETVITDYEGSSMPTYRNVNAPTTTYDECATDPEAQCCDGRTSSGTCTYSRYDDEVFESSIGTLAIFNRSCTCTCPG